MESLKKGQEQFKELYQKRILIYGTGIVARKLLETLTDFRIIGVIDNIRFEGDFLNIPILTWEDIKKDTADVIIIAAARKNYKVIYDRIQYRCFALDIPIYSASGQNLSQEYHLKYFNNYDYKYFQKSEEELKKLIDQYEAVSFDLFDTLIMRKILYPVDIFDLVQNRIKEKGIIVSDFKKKRRTAELESKGGDIYRIYDCLRKNIGISEKESMLILQEEIQCEKQCLIPRDRMVKIMNYAINSGKKVSIISDMYLPSFILNQILSSLGVTGYEKLYISCEYGVGKGNGLFRIYREDIGNKKCLHIGDNIDADIVAPGKYGIDSYEVKSAYEMLKISSVRKLLLCADGVNNNILLGLLLAEIFNDPFALYHTNGILSIRSVNTFANLFIAPVVLVYMQKLLEVAHEKKYDAILFSSRDGYLFKKIYDMLFQKEYKIPSIYFMASRKLCLSATIENEKDVLKLGQYFPQKDVAEDFLKDFIGEENISPFHHTKGSDTGNYFLSHFDQMKRCSSVLKKYYYKYIAQEGIYTDKKYLLCDLCSHGTVHSSLNRLFSCELDGFYLCDARSFENRKNTVFSVYDTDVWNNIVEKDDLLETVLTSFDPSVYAVNEKGDPVYSTETRSKQELDCLRKMQEAIITFIQRYLELRNITDKIGKELPDIALGLNEVVNYADETELLLDQSNRDDMSQKHIAIINEFSPKEER